MSHFSVENVGCVPMLDLLLWERVFEELSQTEVLKNEIVGLHGKPKTNKSLGLDGTQAFKCLVVKVSPTYQYMSLNSDTVPQL